MVKVALIGSFREQNYPRVQTVLRAFREAGFTITSPSGADIVTGTEFVRFASDDTALTDAEIQTSTLAKIFDADVVYVVTGKHGYVGRTTCYEIGRIIQRGTPIYFSDAPDDLPVHIPPTHVVDPDSFVLRFLRKREPLSWLFESGAGDLFDGERRLV
ncbi:MAG: hypothetical protein O9288_16510 [Novosphingobium sp.]|jgi:hypothetical protein|uniref:hypothetical protein n=1 Tax=Novosphingobium sp. TaxID=1874826 RepID=UPI0022BEF775|nr:hypothetical protein [Novosphingobium sp.]MCZ8036343.1 hypothetical protein [Novosphingobium sp.]